MSYNTKAVIGWCAGILATVISSVAIYYFTRPAPVPPSPPAAVYVEGRVVDIAASKIIPNAMVGLKAGTQAVSQATDSAGCYLIEVDGLPDTTAATLTIDAPGYPHYSTNSTLAKLRDAGDNELLPPATQNAGGTPANPSGTPANTPVSPGGATINPGRGPTLGAIVAKFPGLRGGADIAPAPAGANPKSTVTLPPYVRRADAVRITKAPAH
jgi:hypothetical protein